MKITKLLVFFVLTANFYSAPTVAEFAQEQTITAQQILKLGIFPRRNAKATHKQFKPLADYLSAKLGRKVQLVTSKNFAEFWKAVHNQEFDLVHYNQLHYIDSHRESGYKVILMNEEFGDNTIAGAIAVRKDSGINHVEDFRGKKILFGGDKSAMIAYIINTYYLRKHGLKKGDYIELFAKNPPNATLAMYHKHADAAGIGDIGLKIPMLKKSRVDENKIKLFITSPRLPHLPWAVKKSISDELANQIQQVLTQLGDSEEGKHILRRAKLTGLRVATDQDYNDIRKILGEYQVMEAAEDNSQGSRAKKE